MPPYAVQVTMDVSWKGIREEFSNTFHYDIGTVSDFAGYINSLADTVVAEIRPLHSTLVDFKRVRVHGPTHLTKVEDVMHLVKDLTGTGSGPAGADIPPEMAVVADVYVGRGPRGGKQFLRKYFHSRQFPGVFGNFGKGAGIEPLEQVIKDAYISRLNNLKNVTIGVETSNVCTPNGKHLPVGSTWTVDDYTATRQFRRRGKRRITTV